MSLPLPRHLQRMSGWLLLLAVVLHLFMGHHEGSELVVCLQKDGQISLETVQHGTAAAQHQQDDCGHEDCHDIHFSFAHAETVLIQKIADFQPDLTLTAFCFEFFASDLLQMPVQGAIELPRRSERPPDRIARLRTTILLI